MTVKLAALPSRSMRSQRAMRASSAIVIDERRNGDESTGLRPGKGAQRMGEHEYGREGMRLGTGEGEK